jgi:hypothetical protein
MFYFKLNDKASKYTFVKLHIVHHTGILKVIAVNVIKKKCIQL